MEKFRRRKTTAGNNNYCDFCEMTHGNKWKEYVYEKEITKCLANYWHNTSRVR